jgi:hypothetical protein
MGRCGEQEKSPAAGPEQAISRQWMRNGKEWQKNRQEDGSRMRLLQSAGGIKMKKNSDPAGGSWCCCEERN